MQPLVTVVLSKTHPILHMASLENLLTSCLGISSLIRLRVPTKQIILEGIANSASIAMALPFHA